MNLYLLKLKRPANYDETAGFVVRANSSDMARGLSASADYSDVGGPGVEGARTWLEAALSDCHLIGIATEGKSGVVLRDFRAG